MKSLFFALLLGASGSLILVPQTVGATTEREADSREAREALTFRYAEFVGAFRARNWRHVCDFVTDETQAGFGPGQMGCEGVKAVFAEDRDCWDDMVFALRQGCRVNADATACSSPPQLGSDVIHLGARAAFSYDPDSDELKASWLICGGD